MSKVNEQKHLLSLGDHLAVCIKDLEKCVQFQNSLSEHICGPTTGRVCNKSCMTMYETASECVPTFGGMSLYKNVEVEGQKVDAVIIEDHEKVTTLLQLHQEEDNESLRKKEAFYQDRGLTKSELRIMGMVNQGYTNAMIAEKLFISKATLKTHLNNIYKKLPKAMKPTQRRG